MAWDDFPTQKGSSPRGGGGQFGKNDPPFDFPKINLPDFKPGKIIYIAGLILAVWFASSIFFIVGPDEKGVVLRFGEHVRTVDSGLNWKLPTLFETVLTPKVTQVRREEIGFRLIDQGPPARYRDIPEESLMLTGDENIVDIDVVVQYKISNPLDYLFNVRQVRKAVLDASEAAIREVTGSRKIDEALTAGKFQIQAETKELVQAILDRYKSGIQIITVQLQDVHPPKQVIDAFKDVVSAREDKERMINEAQGYQNMVIPEARGKAAQVIKVAEGYREEKINMAKGDAEKFIKIFEEYKKAKDITKKRLYIDMMEEVLPDIRKIIIDKDVSSNIVPILPLGDVQKVTESLIKGAKEK